MIEVERKYRCSSSVVAAVETVAERVAAPVDQTDLYLNAPDRDFAETDEALRIRSTRTAEEHIEVVITFKGPRSPGAAKARREHEVGVDEFDETAAIFDALGYITVAEVQKHRRQYDWAGVDVSIDTLGSGDRYIELERTVKEAEAVDEADAEIVARSAELGLSPDDLEPRSYLELTLEYERE
jgi:adenylate cyclase class 2